jgi:hypothetical protein
MKTIKTKNIDLGYIALEGYDPSIPLVPTWDDRPAKKGLKEDEVILPGKQEFLLQITYPLSIPYSGIIKTPAKGMTRREVVNKIVECYERIYREEDEAVGKPTPMITGMLNRDTSDGPYGIWGHVLSDLMLHTLNVAGNKLTVGVDS